MPIISKLIVFCKEKNLLTKKNRKKFFDVLNYLLISNDRVLISNNDYNDQKIID